METKKEATSKLTIRQKLTLIQNRINAPKNKYNEFGNFKYRSLEDILQALKPLLQEYNITFYFEDEIKQIGDRFYVKSTATISDDEDSIGVAAFARETLEKTKMDDAQVTGGASSYARKYAISGLLLLDDANNKDPDGLNNAKKETPKPAGKTERLEKVVLADVEYQHVKGTSKTGKPFDGFFPTDKESQAKRYFTVEEFQSDLKKFKSENINSDEVNI